MFEISDQSHCFVGAFVLIGGELTSSKIAPEYQGFVVCDRSLEQQTGGLN